MNVAEQAINGAKHQQTKPRKWFTIALILAILWSLLFLAAAAVTSSWLPLPQPLDGALSMLTLVSGAGLFIALITLLVISLVRREFRPAYLLPIAVMIGAIALIAAMPLKPAVTFRRHREEFATINRAAIDRFITSGDRNVPESDLFHSAVIAGRDRSDVVVQYEVVPFDNLVIYIASDKPEELKHICSEGGAVAAKLEPNWYICSPAWN
jgi:hypothetical protein